MKHQLPPPSNWQDFEDLCLALWKSIWGNPNAHKNGRSGQTQHGVDIWGQPFYESGYSGVQCKGKDVNFGKPLTAQEMKDEVGNADEFKPSLQHFIMATTSPSDVAIQEECRKLNESKEHDFDVDVWSWTEIADEIQCRPNVYKQLYGDSPIDYKNAHEIRIGRLDGASRVWALLTRDEVRDSFSTTVLELMSKLIFELVDNAIRHAHSSSVSVRYEKEGTFEIAYTGNQFDTRALEYNGNGGHYTYVFFKEQFKEAFRVEYEYVSEKQLNITRLSLSLPVRKTELHPIEVELPPVEKCMNRDMSRHLANDEIDRYMHLGVKIKILVRSGYTLSGSLTFFEEIFRHMRDNVDSVCLPDEEMLCPIKELCEKYSVKVIVR